MTHTELNSRLDMLTVIKSQLEILLSSVAERIETLYAEMRAQGGDHRAWVEESMDDVVVENVTDVSSDFEVPVKNNPAWIKLGELSASHH